MDSSKWWLALLIVFSVGCDKGDTEKDSVVTTSNEPFCADSLVKGQYIINWKNGEQSLVYAENEEELRRDVLEPNKGNIDFAEPNYRMDTPQKVQSQSLGSNSIDNWGVIVTEAEKAWQSGFRGQDVLVAVVDSGVDLKHTQLQANVFVNPGESGLDSAGQDKSTNGVDDDGNGYIDDVSGWDFRSGNGFVYDDSGHGTHVSGIIAAHHEDNEVVTDYVQGIAPAAQLLALDFLDAQGGLISSAIEALRYAADMGAKVINASWGGPGCSLSLEKTIAELGQRGVLFVTAAGNEGTNIDRYKRYPASHNLANQITVGSLSKPTADGFMFMAGHSNNGPETVHLFAPGFEIISTIPNDRVVAFTGTSMATPFVAGAAALLWSQYPKASVEQIKNMILSSVITDESYQNITQGRLALGSLFEAYHPPDNQTGEQ
jgi:subtilisin family serine protease